MLPRSRLFHRSFQPQRLPQPKLNPLMLMLLLLNQHVRVPAATESMNRIGSVSPTFEALVVPILKGRLRKYLLPCRCIIVFIYICAHSADYLFPPTTYWDGSHAVSFEEFGRRISLPSYFHVYSASATL